MTSRAVVAGPWLIDRILGSHVLFMTPLVLGCVRLVIGLVLKFLGGWHVVVLMVHVEVLHMVSGRHVLGHLVVEVTEHRVGSNLHILFWRLVHLAVARGKKPIKFVLVCICPLRLAGSHHR